MRGVSTLPARALVVETMQEEEGSKQENRCTDFRSMVAGHWHDTLLASLAVLVLQHEWQPILGIADDHNLRILRLGEPLRCFNALPL